MAEDRRCSKMEINMLESIGMVNQKVREDMSGALADSMKETLNKASVMEVVFGSMLMKLSILVSLRKILSMAEVWSHIKLAKDLKDFLTKVIKLLGSCSINLINKLKLLQDE